MNRWRVKKGNTSVQEIEVRDKDNQLVANLADATDIKFQVKEKPEDLTPMIEKTKDEGIAVDTPNTGWLRITLLPSDTDIEGQVYFMALEIIWSPDEKYETRLYVNNGESDKFEIEENHIL